MIRNEFLHPVGQTDAGSAATAASETRCHGGSGEEGEYFLSGEPDLETRNFHLPPGQRLFERYTLRQEIGRGAHGTVYRATDDLRGNEVAIKVRCRATCATQHSDSLFRREAEVREHLADGRHVIAVFGVHRGGLDGLQLDALTMEYADGGSLRDWLVQHAQDAARRRDDGLSLFRRMCQGVADMHAAGFFHLDLKPEHFLFCSDVLKVCDFETARRVGDDSNEDVSDVGTPFLQGTLAYASPEVIAGQSSDPDARSDVYSLGVILFEMLHPRARRPFDGSAEQLRRLHLRASPPALPQGPAEVNKIITRCLAPEPAKRFANASELLDALDAMSVAEANARTAERECAWHAILERIEATDLNAAAAACIAFLRRWPEDGRASELQTLIQRHHQQSAAIYETIQSELGGGALGRLAEMLIEAQKIYPDHPAGRAVQVQLAAQAREFRRCMESGCEELCRGAWEAALQNFQRACALDRAATGAMRAASYTEDILGRVRQMRANTHDALQRREGRVAMAWARGVDRFVASIRAGLPGPGDMS